MLLKWFLLASLLSLTTAPVLPAADSAAQRPNFIFILADDLGWSDLGCYGHPQLKTPNLDRLAKEGTLFTQFYVGGSVCLSPGGSKPATYGRFKPSRSEVRTSYHLFDLVQG